MQQVQLDDDASGLHAGAVCVCVCVGVVTTMFSLGPFTGNLLAALTLRLPENLLSDGQLHYCMLYHSVLHVLLR